MLILASASPRRQELLKQIGASFTVQSIEVQECMDERMSPKALVKENAYRKAIAVANARKKAGDTACDVLGADTIVVLDGEIFGKPKSDGEAAWMLHCLAGETHSVYTGVAIVTADGPTYVDAAETRVTFAPMTEMQIMRYVSTGESRGKAGAYAIQGRAAVHIVRIDGEFSNVVGLPLHLVAKLAERAMVNLYDDDGAGSTAR